MKKALLILFATFVTLTACKKGNDETKEETPPKGSVVSDKKTTTPGDLVTLKFSTALTKESYEILVGDKKAALAKISDSTGVFIVPFVTAGVKTINLASTNTADIEITIDTYTVVDNPDLAKTAFLSELSSAAANLPNGPEKEFLVMAEKDIADKYNQLSNEEKKQFAFALKKLSFDPPAVQSNANIVNYTSFNNAYANPKELAGVAITNEFIFYRETLGCIATTTLGSISLSAGVTLLYVPFGTFLDKAVGAAAITTGVVLLLNGIETAKNLARYKGIPVSLADLIELVSSNNTQTHSTREVNVTNSILTFKGGKNHSLKFSGIYSNMSKETTLPFFSSFITKMEAAVASYNSTAKTINKIKGFFSSTPALNEMQINIDQQSSSGNANVPANLLTIENISDSQISLVKASDDNNFIVKATGSSITTEKAFTFDIVYTFSPFNIKLRKTINAVFDGTIEPYKVALASGNNQTGESGKQLANALQVLVTDENSQPLANVDVDWKIKTGGGTLTTATSKTNAQGLASTRWTLGSTGSQAVEASVKKKDGSVVIGAPVTFTAVTPCSEALAPVITGISFNCNSNGKYGVYVAFTSTGSDLLIGSGSGTCNLETNCYPSRLLIKDTVDPNSDFHVASNSYDARLFSGTPRQGVIEFTFGYTGNCIPNKSAEESFRYYYSRFLWKVQLMNQCNKRSEQVPF